MNDLNFILNKTSQPSLYSKPEIFNLSKKKDRILLHSLIKKNHSVKIIDTYLDQLKEFFEILNPKIVFGGNIESKFLEYKKLRERKNAFWQQGRWVYFPWLNNLVHILKEDEFFAVRTARNKLLVYEEEQKKFYSSKIGIAGLSIGSSVALALVIQGGAKYLKLADFDTLSLSNTNRIRAGVQNLGLLKTEVALRQIYEINPYAKIEVYPEGVNEKNIKKFVADLDVIVDEMDNLSTKVLLRKEAKNKKIPMVMGADNADMAVIDVERYDKNSKLTFFHGRIKNSNFENLSKYEIGKNIANLIGLENHTERMFNSLQEMGKTLVSWPQLGGTAMLNGAAVAYCVRKIVTGQNLTNDRQIISFEQIFTPNYNSPSSIRKRHYAIKQFKKFFKL